MDIKLLFCGCLGRTNDTAAAPQSRASASHRGRVYRLIQTLPVSASFKAALIGKFSHKGQKSPAIDHAQRAMQKIHSFLAEQLRSNQHEENFLPQLRDNLLCSIYHSRMNEFGKHLAQEGKTFDANYLRDIGAVMKPYVKGTEKNGIFTPSGGASNMLTNNAFHLLRQANREAAFDVEQASARAAGREPVAIARLSDAQTSSLHQDAADMTDKIVLAWFHDDTADIYQSIHDKLAYITNNHMPHATRTSVAPRRARG